jgi:hypothetical protein
MASLARSAAACVCSAVSRTDQPAHLPRWLRRAIGVEGAWQWRPSASKEHLDGGGKRGSGILVHGGAAAACALDPKEDDGNQLFLPKVVSLVSSHIVPREDVVPSQGNDFFLLYPLSSITSLPHQLLCHVSV